MKRAWLCVPLLLCSILQAEIAIPEHFEADFVQMVTNPKKKVITYEGDVKFSDSNKMKWKYSKPTQKEVCTNGKDLLVVDHDLEQASYYRIRDGFDLLSILKSAKKHKDHIYLASYQDKTYTIKTAKDDTIQSVAYYDDLDNKVQILFKKMRYGKGKLDPTGMKCQIPKTYDIIKG